LEAGSQDKSVKWIKKKGNEMAQPWMGEEGTQRIGRFEQIPMSSTCSIDGSSSSSAFLPFLFLLKTWEQLNRGTIMTYAEQIEEHGHGIRYFLYLYHITGAKRKHRRGVSEGKT
jgi:hypothetical protein